LDLAIKGTNAGLWDWHMQTGQVIFNERWAEIIGYTVKELEPISIQTWIDSCHPEDLIKSNSQIEKYLSGGTDIYRCEVRMRHKNGNWVWVLDRGKVVKWDELGKPLRMVGTHIDITDKKHYEAIIQAERDMAEAWSRSTTFKERLAVCLRLAIEVSSMDCGGLYRVNETDGSLQLEVYQGLSQEFAKETQYYPRLSFNAQMVQRGAPIFSLHETLKPYKSAIKDLEGLKAICIIPIRFQGKAIACLNLASRSLDSVEQRYRESLERIAVYLGSFIFYEILEEKNRQIRQDLETFFNSINDMLFINDVKGKILSCNSASARLGYTEDEFVERNFISLFPEESHPEISAFMTQAIAKESDICLVPIMTKAGQLIQVEIKIILGHWNNQDALYCFIRDISERLQLERQTRQVAKAESLGRMAGSIAHNFNNMLGVVVGNLELTMVDVPRQGEIYENLSDALKAAKKATDVSRLMLTYLGQANVKHEPFDLSDECRKSLRIIRQEIKENITIEIDFPDSGPIINGSIHQIHQLLRNLLMNAVESFDDHGGAIYWSIKTLPSTSIPKIILPVEFHPGIMPYACLKVKDTGYGISEKDLDKIFDPFFSTKFVGRGLGLSVILGILRQHEGAISVESFPGKGSNFQIYLPLSDKEILYDIKNGPVANKKYPCTILLVEDEKSVQKMSAKMLSRLGYNVLLADDGAKAVEVFKHHLDQISLVICDLVMPQMNGWETMAELRKLAADIPIVLVSGFDEAQAIEGHQTEKPQAFLQKPFGKLELERAIEKALGASFEIE
jgi:PAS domain S-box-containing protein